MRRVILLVTVSATMLAMCVLPALAQDPTGQAPQGTVCKVKPPKASAKGVKRHPIQVAVNKDACATILLAPGTYRENVRIDRNVTIRGVEGDERTIVHGGGSGPVFDNSKPIVEGEGDPDIYLDGSTVTLTGLTITGGKARVHELPSPVAGGGGIFSAGELTINDSTVRGNTAKDNGGGIQSYYSGISLNGSTVSGNTAGWGTGGIDGYNGSVTINDSTVSGNTGGGHGGGGIETYEGSITLNSSAVRDNTARYGGGIHAQYGRIELNNSTISGNTALVNGGGINSYQGDITLNESSTISGNIAQGDGGGIHSTEGDRITLGDSTISGNTAQGHGGGVYIFNYASITLSGDSGIENNSPDDVYNNEDY